MYLVQRGPAVDVAFCKNGVIDGNRGIRYTDVYGTVCSNIQCFIVISRCFYI